MKYSEVEEAIKAAHKSENRTLIIKNYENSAGDQIDYKLKLHPGVNFYKILLMDSVELIDNNPKEVDQLKPEEVSLQDWEDAKSQQRESMVASLVKMESEEPPVPQHIKSAQQKDNKFVTPKEDSYTVYLPATEEVEKKYVSGEEKVKKYKNGITHGKDILRKKLPLSRYVATLKLSSDKDFTMAVE